MEHSEGGHQERRPQLPQHYLQQQQQEQQEQSLGGRLHQPQLTGIQHSRSWISQQQQQQQQLQQHHRLRLLWMDVRLMRRIH
mmetsp:Transcript_22322/g.25852  ORF Transcript_22322/g.25852 Transcript_22322/m.25852 type:complete len:82 (+) Transcript_22322:238-483(+)